MAKEYFETTATTNFEVIGAYFSPVSDQYKKKGLVSVKHRVNMTRAAVEDSDYIMVDNWEASQPKWAVTKLVLDHFIEEVNRDVPPNQPRTHVMLLCGSDLLDSFNTPNLWSDEDIKSICSYGIVCISRVGADPEQVLWSNDVLYSQRNQIILIHQWVPNGISSTLIRKALARNLSVKYLVTDSVLEYIEKK